MVVHPITVSRRIRQGWDPLLAATTPALNLPADLAGKRFGSLVPERIVGHQGKTGQRHVVWACKCDCGSLKYVTAANLRNGSTKTCGCRLRRLKEHGLTHGHARARKSLTYGSWLAMLQRCYNSNGKKYRYYGGRGIRVCDAWKGSFESFLSDMGERRPGYTLDRIDPDGNYEPTNCRWATKREQLMNTRRSNAKRCRA